MLKIVPLVFAVLGLVSSNPLPALTGAMHGGVTTSHHSTATAAHHPVGMGYGMYGMGGFGSGVVKHTETMSAGFPAATAVSSHYSAYGAYPGIGALGFGAYGAYPAAKQVTQVTTTAVRPGMYGYF